MNRKLAPFNIAGPGYEEFVTAISDIAYTACEYGAEQLRAAGKSPADIQDDQEAQRHFIADCHRGFAQAQAAVGEQVIELEAVLKNATQELKEARRNRDQDKARDLVLRIEALTNRQLALRRIEDYIYFMLLNREAHRYKRFLAHRKLQSVDPDVLRETLSFAETRNSETPLRFTLVADLTTGMHMADLIEIDRSNPEPEISIIEMKTGETNRVLLEILSKKPDKAAIQQLDSMGPKAWQQLERMMRQHRRLKDAHTVLTTDRGFDALNQMPIVLMKEPVPVDGFLEMLINVCVEATKAGVSCSSVDECLSLVAIREDCGLTITDGLVAHYFYHLDPDTAECALAKGDDAAKDEIRHVAQYRQFIDLGKFQLQDLSCPGLFATVPTPIALDILTGRLRLFARFDVPRFFAYAERHGIKLTWASRKESADAIRRKVSSPIPGSPESSAAVRYRVGDRFEGMLFSGFFARAFRDLLRSSDLIEFLKA